MTVICKFIRARGFIYLFFSAAVTITGAARAQEPANIDISNPNVTVDLSVLNDNGMGGAARPGGLLTRPGGFRLLMPGARPPRSRLYIRPHGVAKKGVARKRPARNVARKRPLRKKTEPAVAITGKIPPPAKIAAAPAPIAKKAPVAKKKAAAKLPPERITNAPPPPPALKPMKAEKKAAAKKAKKEPVKTAAIAPRKLVPAAKVKETPKKEIKKEPAKFSPLKAVAAIPPPPAVKIKAPKAPVTPVKRAEPKKEMASLPPLMKAAPARSANLKVVFAANTSKLPNQVKAGLNKLAGIMRKKEELRIQLLAYAGGKSLSSSRARRLSLSRALSVRSYLIGKGIRSTRIDVRALGNKTTEEPLNRVDVNVIKR